MFFLILMSTSGYDGYYNEYMQCSDQLCFFLIHRTYSELHSFWWEWICVDSLTRFHELFSYDQYSGFVRWRPKVVTYQWIFLFL